MQLASLGVLFSFLFFDFLAGLSNVMAVECASRLDAPAHDLDFYYFTAGLGGSGKVNLAITNFGFGDPVMNFRKGRLSPIMNAGLASQVSS
jgi:hypothetical protein